MTDRREQSDAEMSEKMKKQSSLTSLRKDNEVIKEEEINQSVTEIFYDRESIVMLWTAISRQRVKVRSSV